ncbi:MAG: tocopherol cyclase family protein [Candidatus Izemoplasmataceae bacterium]
MSTFEYQGKRHINYFEGWYTRIIDLKQAVNLAVIFAVTYYEEDPHAFIQIFDQVNMKNTYLRYDVHSFKADQDEIWIESNRLTLNHLKIVSDAIHIDVSMKNHNHLNKFSAMGFLEKLPLECYQEVLYLDAHLEGIITINGETKNLLGHSYMEKTYGKNFPKRWFWLQANNVKDAFSFTLAGGSVPTLFFTKFGFFIIIKYHEKEYAFGTYNFAKLKVEKVGEHVYFTVKKGTYKITITAYLKNPVNLVGPSKGGNMNLDVLESIESTMTLQFYHHKNLLYEGEFSHAGFEWMYEK